jgi:quercetin dioxygenase-like cupin family protein
MWLISDRAGRPPVSGPRTACDHHPLGRTLIVTAGAGWVPRRSGPREAIRPGEMVWIAAGE